MMMDEKGRSMYPGDPPRVSTHQAFDARDFIKNGGDASKLTNDLIMFFYVGQSIKDRWANVGIDIYGVDTDGELITGEDLGVYRYRTPILREVATDILHTISQYHPKVTLAFNTVDNDKDNVGLKIFRMSADSEGIVSITSTTAIISRSTLDRFNIPEKFLRILNLEPDAWDEDKMDMIQVKEFQQQTIKEEIDKRVRALLPEGSDDLHTIPPSKVAEIVRQVVKEVTGDDVEAEVHKVEVDPTTGKPKVTEVWKDDGSVPDKPKLDPHTETIGFTKWDDTIIN